MNVEPRLIVLVGVVFISGYALYPIINQVDEPQRFITKCNEIHGIGSWNKGNWTVIKISQYTTYSDEFWRKYPRIYINTGLLDSESYSCFKI